MTTAELFLCQRYGCRMLPKACLAAYRTGDPKCAGCRQVRWIEAAEDANAALREEMTR